MNRAWSKRTRWTGERRAFGARCLLAIAHADYSCHVVVGAALCLESLPSARRNDVHIHTHTVAQTVLAWRLKMLAVIVFLSSVC